MINIDPNTGVHYGIIAGNRVPDLLEWIMDHGLNHTLQQWRDEVEYGLNSCLGDLDFSDNNPDVDRNLEFRNALITGLMPWVCSRDAHDIACAICDEHFDAVSGTFAIAEVVGAGFQALIDMDCDRFENECFEATRDGITYKTGELGGAILISVVQSPFVTYCAPCSPCVRNAGDLEEPTALGEGFLTYCLAPEDFPASFIDTHCLLKIQGRSHDELILNVLRPPGAAETPHDAPIEPVI